MNTNQLEALQKTLNNSSLEKRSMLLKYVSSLLQQNNSNITAQHIQILGNISESLIDNVDLDTQIQTAEIFAHLKLAPHGLIHKLAHLRIEVAAPVLENSLILSDDDLIEIILKNNAEYLKCIVNRKILSSRTTDSLMDVPDNEILSVLIQNTGASFSHNSFKKLTEIGINNDSIAKSLIDRSDMPYKIAADFMENLGLMGHGKLMEKGEKLRIKFGEQALQAHKLRNQRELFLPLTKTIIDQIGRGEKSLNDSLMTLCELGNHHVLCQVIAAYTQQEEEIITTALGKVNGTHLLKFCNQLELSRETFHAIIKLRTKHRDLPDSQIIHLMRQFDSHTI
ncbi:MAG: DUF2336 domain-containing protein [Hyphomicrobiales bacterium]